MKKIYTLVAAVVIGATSFGQTTITSHFQGALTNPQAPQIAVYNWQDANQNDLGFISGTNTYGDLGVVQLFDNAYGVTGAGTIDNIKVAIAVKNQAPTAGSITVGVWENNGGNVGTLLASQVVSLNDVDTSAAGTQLIPNAGGTAILGIYNVNVTFSTAPAIPANNSFFAGVLLPTTAAAGDAAAVLTTSIPFNFANAGTHAGVVEATGDFVSYTDALSSLTISNAIFPTITLATSSIADVLKAQTRLYPNPANDVVNIEFGTEEVASVSIINLNGQVVLNGNVNNGTAKLDVSSLQSGLYIYQALDASGNVLNADKFSKN